MALPVPYHVLKQSHLDMGSADDSYWHRTTAIILSLRSNIMHEDFPATDSNQLKQQWLWDSQMVLEKEEDHGLAGLARQHYVRVGRV